MSGELGTTPFIWLTLDEAGNLVDGVAPLRAIHAAMERTGARDLLILSHGWKNERKHALTLYRDLWRHSLPHLPPSRPFVVAGIVWPAAKYPTDFDAAALDALAGVQALAGQAWAAPRDLDARQFEQIVRAALPGPENLRLRRLARDAAQRLDRSSGTALVKGMLARLAELSTPSDQPDPEIAAEQAALADAAASDPMRLLNINARPLIAGQGSGQDGGQGGGQALGGAGGSGVFPAGPRATIARLLNQFTYYPMKVRAGTAGAGLARFLDPQPFLRDKRLHLAGHSFGGRLVTSCAAHMKTLRPQSMTLLQAAFSHNGLAARTPYGTGAFASLLADSRVKGPIAVTHTHNDRACTVWYPLASRVKGDRTLGWGDRSDPYGAMGANGAQYVQALVHPGFPAPGLRQPVSGKVNNYLADAEIVAIKGGPDAHNNVANAGTGRLLATVMMA